MDIYVINLDRETHRLSTFRAVNRHLKRIVRFPAVDGAAIERSQLRADGILRTAMPAYSDAVVGCALSHISLWRKAAAQSKPFTIAEDDAIFNLRFEAAASALLRSLPSTWDILLWGWNFDSILFFDFLPGVSPCLGIFSQAELRKQAAAFQILDVKPHAYRLQKAFGTLAYSVSPQGAQKLLKFCLPVREMEVYCPGLNRSIPNCSFDVMLNSLYPKIKAFVSFPPLAASKNEMTTSVPGRARMVLRARPTQPLRLPFKFPAVIFGNATGDHLLALPALRALTRLFPSRLSLICMPGFRRTFFADLPLRSVCEVEMRRRGQQRLFDATAVARRIGRCDLFLSLNPWRSVSLDRLVTLLAPALSVGFSPAFQISLPKSPKLHAADSAFKVPAYLDPSLRLDGFASPPQVPARARNQIRQFLKAAAPGKRILAVHNETQPKKTWPRDRLSRLLTEFLKRHPDFVIVILDFRKPNLKVGKFKHRVIHSRGLPLPYAFALLRESDLFLGADSCMLHAADLFRVPGVGLFGPTEPRRWGFRFSRHRHIRDPRGLNHIHESRVLKALESLLRHPNSMFLRRAL